MYRPWYNSSRWSSSQDCHNLCRVLSGLPARGDFKDLKQIFATVVADFLQPPQELIACVERTPWGSRKPETCIHFFDAESLAFVGNINVILRVPSMNHRITSASVSQEGGSVLLYDVDSILMSSQSNSGSEAIEWRDIVDAIQLLDLSIDCIECVAISPDGLQLTIGCSINVIGPRDSKDECQLVLLLFDRKSFTVLQQVPLCFEPCQITYSPTGSLMAVIGHSHDNAECGFVGVLSTKSMSMERVARIDFEGVVTKAFFTSCGHLILCFTSSECGDSMKHSCMLLNVANLRVMKVGGPHHPEEWACDHAGRHLAVSDGDRQTLILDCSSLDVITASNELPDPEALLFDSTGEHLIVQARREILDLSQAVGGVGCSEESSEAEESSEGSDWYFRTSDKYECKMITGVAFYVLQTRSLTVLREKFVPGLHIGGRLGKGGVSMVPVGCIKVGTKLEQVERDCIEHNIVHADMASERDEDMLQLQADFDWADSVETRIRQTRSFKDIPVEADAPSEFAQVSNADSEYQNQVAPKVHLLHFGSPPSSGNDALHRFREQLLKGPELGPCRKALCDAHGENACALRNRALIFTDPDCYLEVQQALPTAHDFSKAGLHVIIDAQYEYLVDEILSRLPFQKRPKVKPGNHGRSEILFANCSGSASTEKLEQAILMVSRTFISYAHPLRNQGSVTQSTTDAVHLETGKYHRSVAGHVVVGNPRRMIPVCP